jgi:hypothetical protein
MADSDPGRHNVVDWATEGYAQVAPIDQIRSEQDPTVFI